MKSRLTHKDSLLCTILIVIAAYLYIYIGGMTEATRSGAIASSTYPRIILGFIILISLILIFRDKSQMTLKPLSFPFKELIAVALIAIYISLIESVGYFIMTPIVLFCIPMIAGYTNYIKVAISTVLVTISLYLVFVQVLNIPLP